MGRVEALQAFENAFGKKAEDLFTAAGRINVIGEHVDYCGGKVFPAALNLRCNIYGKKTGENVVRLAFRGIDDVVELDVNALNDYRHLKIGNYQAGVAYFMRPSLPVHKKTTSLRRPMAMLLRSMPPSESFRLVWHTKTMVLPILSTATRSACRTFCVNPRTSPPIPLMEALGPLPMFSHGMAVQQRANSRHGILLRHRSTRLICLRIRVLASKLPTG